MFTILARYDANETEPPEWELIFPSVFFQSIAFWRFKSSLEFIGGPNILDHGIPIFLLYPNRTFIHAINNICGLHYWQSFIVSSCQLLVQGNLSFIFQILQTISSSSSGKAYFFYQIQMISKKICKQHHKIL